MPQLSDFKNAQLQHAEIAGLARLHLFMTMRTHELMGDFSKRAGGRLIAAAGGDGKLALTEAFRAQQSMHGWWGDVMKEWTQEFQAARNIAAHLPFGWMAEMHQRLISSQVGKLESWKVSSSTFHVSSEKLEDWEGFSSSGKIYLEKARVNEALPVVGSDAWKLANAAVFDPQIQVLVDAAANYLYGDGLNLSQRIWQMNNDALNGMNQLILAAVTNGTSAFDLAQQLEMYLGANADCPRWTSTRLYKMTKKDIAGGDLRGLVSGDACDGQGVAYNALRLARTEIQKIHALATDRVLAQSPWVEQEQVNLSKGHPEADICDQVIADGEKGDGIYPVGTIELPLHPNCLCYKTAVLMPEDEFINKLAAWTRGEEAWSEMDAYAELVGGQTSNVGDVDLSKEPSLLMLAVWMFGNELKL